MDKPRWQEIVRIGNTQKIVTTTTGKNQEDETIFIRRCSEPNEKIQTIYKALNYKSYPFLKRKSVVQSSERKKNKIPIFQNLSPG